jgi:hypothetical protein
LVLLALLRHVVAPDGVVIDFLASSWEGEIVLVFIGQGEFDLRTVFEAVAQQEVQLIVKDLIGLIQEFSDSEVLKAGILEVDHILVHPILSSIDY